MDNFNVAVFAVVVLIVLYFLFYSPKPVSVVNNEPAVQTAITKATASCAAIKDEVTFNSFSADYVAANTAIKSVLTPSAELTASITAFNNLTCSKYSSYLIMIDLFDAAYTKALAANASEADLKNAGVLIANISLLEPLYRNGMNTPAYLAKQYKDIKDKMDKSTQKGMPPAGMVVYFADELLKIVVDEEAFAKRQKDPAFYENYKIRLNDAKRALAQFEKLGPIGPQGTKLKNMVLYSN